MTETYAVDDMIVFPELSERGINPDDLPGTIIGDFDVKFYRTNVVGGFPFTKHIYFSPRGESRRFEEREAVFRVGRSFPGEERGFWRIVLHFGTERQYIRWGNIPSDLQQPQLGTVTLERERDSFNEGSLVEGKDYRLVRESAGGGTESVIYEPLTATSGYLFVTSKEISEDPQRPNPFIIPIPSRRQRVYVEAPGETIVPVRAYGDITVEN